MWEILVGFCVNDTKNHSEHSFISKKCTFCEHSKIPIVCSLQVVNLSEEAVDKKAIDNCVRNLV